MIRCKLKLGEVATTIPTIGFNVETVGHEDGARAAGTLGEATLSWPLAAPLRHGYGGPRAGHGLHCLGLEIQGDL